MVSGRGSLTSAGAVAGGNPPGGGAIAPGGGVIGARGSENVGTGPGASRPISGCGVAAGLMPRCVRYSSNDIVVPVSPGMPV